MDGTILAKLVFAFVGTLAVMGASWGLQRSNFFRQAKARMRIASLAATTFAVLFVMQLIWP
ncbi:hypothetical protein ABC977_12460 [Thioalkalicoccus limnaeus]|uniref:Twin transmembrane helix small protein n=1 Tax=Thioalkalicoccus limnaeus TaxID=120681 RepID=A0ABV4BFA8_9GAMM